MRHAAGSILLTTLILVFARSARAAEGAPGGRLLDPEGRPLPLVATVVDAEITDAAARVTVRQVFQNDDPEPIEAIYSFPLPDGAAVDEFAMQIGSRTVRSEILSRELAEERYSTAKLSGRTASLATQVRPNLFTLRLANVLPNERIVCELTYVEDLERIDGAYEFVFPVVAGPRYRAGAGVPAGGADFAAPEEVRHSLDLTVRIDAGLPIRDLYSDSHRIDVRGDGGRRATVTLHPYDRLPVKDFLLSWRTEVEEPEASVLAHRTTGEGTFCLTIQPEEEPGDDARVSREVILVLDCSGSMKGMPIETAKQVAAGTLRTLTPDDSFRILRFADEASGFSRRAEPATRSNVLRGLAYVDTLRGGGGTEVLTGLRMALEARSDPYRMREVLFLTDGLVGNEQEILGELRSTLGDSRVFCLGVGSSINRFLLDRMAEVGRGAAAYLRADATENRILEEVDRFVRRIRAPVLFDVHVDWGDLPVYDPAPARIPDLFAGQPIRLYARYTRGAEGVATLKGRRGGRRWKKQVLVVLPDFERRNSVLGKLWARMRIRELMLAEYAGERMDVREEVCRLALDARLMTRYTAFVAVDERVVVHGSKTRTVRQPAAWPEGVSDDRFLGILALTPGRHDVPAAPPIPTAPAPAPPYVPGPTRPTFPGIDSVPDLHLWFLRSWQEEDGRWEAGGGLFDDTGATSLALLAFLATDRISETGAYGHTVKRAVAWLEKQQAADGAFGNPERPGFLLDHALATIAWLDYEAATGWKTGWSRACRAVERLAGRQIDGLGFPRDDRGTESDTLATALATLALLRANEAGIRTPKGWRIGVLAHLESVTDRLTGRVLMRAGADEGTDGTAIAAAILARTALGARTADVAYLRRGARALLDLPAPVGENVDPLYLFLATTAMSRIGGEEFRAWPAPLNEACRRGMIPEQAKNGGGKPILVGPAGARVGRVAAMALFGLSRGVYEPGSRPFPLR